MKNYSYADIQEITQNGLVLKDGTCIEFNIRILNAREHLNNETTSCVAERDCTAAPPYFMFYTNPKTKITVDTHKGLFAKRKNYKDFRHLQLVLQSFNYTTYDLS